MRRGWSICFPGLKSLGRTLMLGALRWRQALVREQLPRLRTEADRAALLANLICEAFGNCMGVVTEDSPEPPLQQLQVGCRS